MDIPDVSAKSITGANPTNLLTVNKSQAVTNKGEDDLRKRLPVGKPLRFAP